LHALSFSPGLHGLHTNSSLQVRDGGLDFTTDTLSFNVFSTYQRGWLSPVGSGDGEEETVP
jgi:hypothetical protein